MSCQINCGKCGEAGSLKAWTNDGIRDLPADNFRCPSCGHWFKRVKEKGTLLTSGYWMPGKIHLKVIREGTVTS